MKKLIKILFINFIAIISLIILGEAVSFYILQKRDKNFHYIFSEKKFKDKYNHGEYHQEFRPIAYGKKEGSIIFFGCCMTHGTGTDFEGSLPYIVNKYTKRTTINRAIPGWGLQHMYFQLTHPNFRNEIPEKPDYIVYTIIKDHYRRLFSNSSANEPYYLTYKIKDGKFINNTNYLINKSLIIYLVKSLYCQYNFDDKLVKYYLIQSYNKAKELYPNIKFIVLDMENIPELYNDEVLIKHGIKVIDLTQYTDGKNIHELLDLWCDDSGHPSALYWEKVIPHISSEFK